MVPSDLEDVEDDLLRLRWVLSAQSLSRRTALTN
jgi:hypothetical protein